MVLDAKQVHRAVIEDERSCSRPKLDYPKDFELQRRLRSAADNNMLCRDLSAVERM